MVKADMSVPIGDALVNRLAPTLAYRLAEAAVSFQRKASGQACRFATVALTNDTVVITLHGALSKAEMALARSPAGDAQVREFHQQLFLTSCEPLRQEINSLLGVPVREAAVEVETMSGTLIQVFSTGEIGTPLQPVDTLAIETWNGSIPTFGPS